MLPPENQFDRELRNKFKHYEPPLSPEIWSNIQQNLTNSVENSHAPRGFSLELFRIFLKYAAILIFLLVITGDNLLVQKLTMILTPTVSQSPTLQESISTMSEVRNQPDETKIAGKQSKEAVVSQAITPSIPKLIISAEPAIHNMVESYQTDTSHAHNTQTFSKSSNLKTHSINPVVLKKVSVPITSQMVINFENCYSTIFITDSINGLNTRRETAVQTLFTESITMPEIRTLEIPLEFNMQIKLPLRKHRLSTINSDTDEQPLLQIPLPNFFKSL